MADLHTAGAPHPHSFIQGPADQLLLKFLRGSKGPVGPVLWEVLLDMGTWDIPAQGTADIVWRNGCLAYTELMFCVCVCMCNRTTIDKINTINKIKKSDHRRA